VQQKTGMLSVAANEKSTVLFFRDGKIISTRDRRSKTRDPFREYLTRYGVLSREELVRITQISAQSKLDLLDILTSEKFFDEQTLTRQWRYHIQETLHDVLTWDQCSYKFISGDDVIAGVKSLGEHLVEPLLMECMRRIDEYPMLLTAFPSEGIRIAASGREVPADVETLETERTVLALLKTPRAVSDIVSRAKLPAFDIYEALKLLKEKGLIVVQTDARAGGETSAAAAAAAARRRRGNPLVVLAATMVYMGAAFLGVWRHADQVLTIARDGVLAHDTAARARVEYRVRWLIEAYRAENGLYPDDLDELGEAGLADPATLSRAAAHDLRYKLTRDRDAYTLL
jgi:hypothetical protein